MTTKTKENWFDSQTYRVYTPDATLFVIIVDDHDGEPMSVDIHGVRGNAPLALWILSISQFINHLLKSGTHISKIITLLDVPVSPKYSQNNNGIRIYSGPDGIKWALTQYLQDKSINKNRRIVLNVGSGLG